MTIRYAPQAEINRQDAISIARLFNAGPRYTKEINAFCMRWPYAYNVILQEIDRQIDQWMGRSITSDFESRLNAVYDLTVLRDHIIASHMPNWK